MIQKPLHSQGGNRFSFFLFTPTQAALLLLSFLLAAAIGIPPLQAQNSTPTPWTMGDDWDQLLSGNSSALGDALSCSIDAVCGASAWSQEVSAVINVKRSATATCTGVLVNNTRQDQTPYILTAHHCGTPSVGQHVEWDFEFNYQSATCGEPNPTLNTRTLTGATVVAAQGGSDDYTLLRLDAAIPADFHVYFAGWSLEDATTSATSTAIGHPKGDAKKITYDDHAPIDAGSYWLAQFDHGTIEAASSGSPLFNDQHQVIGLVRSAVRLNHNACSGSEGDDNEASILFPKLSKIWTAGTPGQQLGDFLDPDGTAYTAVGALEATGPPLVASPIWINEINADTHAESTPETDEFVEIVGPAGTSLTSYVVDVYTCAAQQATIASSHTLTSFTLTEDYAEYGLFVIGGPDLPPALRHQSFAGADVLPDGSGLVVLKDPSGEELFDYQYGHACPATRTTRSEGDSAGFGTMGFASQMPTSATPGTNALSYSPRSPNFDGGQILPVELSSFDAVLDGRAVLLNWTTLTETNNAGFEVQHRFVDPVGSNFEARAFVDGYGTTETPQAYRFRIDELLPGRHTFRLKQIDYDGTFDYSPEVEVIVELAERFVMEAAYPNPFNPQATMRFAVNRQQAVEVSMYDMLGRRVQVLWSGEAEAGRMHEVQIDGSGLPSGVYIIKVRGDSFAETQRVTLVK